MSKHIEVYNSYQHQASIEHFNEEMEQNDKNKKSKNYYEACFYQPNSGYNKLIHPAFKGKKAYGEIIDPIGF